LELNDYQKKIIELKEEKNALLLVHNYQIPELQVIADYLGDSLQLARKAAEADEYDRIVFCGVDFMAETAAILNPDKKVLLPSISARCPMAAMLPMTTLRISKATYPDSPVVLYVNTLAEAKAEADVVCTSSNAADIVAQFDAEEILFGPDKNLGWYVQQQLPDKRIISIPEDGHCRVHRMFGDGSEAMKLKEQHPNAELIVHPECEPEFQMKADYVLSTGGMVKRAKESNAKIFIIGTEIGLTQRLQRENPDKLFLSAQKYAECSAMKRIDLENTYEALKHDRTWILIPDNIAEKARIPIEKMLAMSK